LAYFCYFSWQPSVLLLLLLPDAAAVAVAADLQASYAMSLKPKGTLQAIG
jgi:hypothetical protein